MKKSILRLLQPLSAIFQPCTPLSYRERRAIVLQSWNRHGYQNRQRPGKHLFELHTKINNLMIAR